jgi:hypothetical protein
MEFISFIIFLAFVLFVMFQIAGFVRGHGTWTRAFEQLATRYGGWYSAARTTRPPAATFRYRNAEARVKCHRSRRPRGTPETEFRIRWADRSFRMQVVPAGQPPQLRSLKHSPPCETGDAKFDRQFTVYAGIRRREEARSMLTSAVRWHVTQLKNFLEPIPVQIAFHKGWLVVRKKCYIKDERQLDDFVRFCLELYDQFLLALSEGIHFRDDVVMTAVEEVRCPICSSDIESAMVLCVRCKTPHCLDCWQYNGKCGMYACDETRYTMVGGTASH